MVLPFQLNPSAPAGKGRGSARAPAGGAAATAVTTAAVTTEMVEKIALAGPWDKIRDDLDVWHESVVTTLLVSGDPATLAKMAEIVQA